MKIPSSNIQAPEKFQAPRSSKSCGSARGVWNLKLGISLDVGAWMLELFFR
jgi:hypothetical protein